MNEIFYREKLIKGWFLPPIVKSLISKKISRYYAVKKNFRIYFDPDKLKKSVIHIWKHEYESSGMKMNHVEYIFQHRSSKNTLFTQIIRTKKQQYLKKQMQSLSLVKMEIYWWIHFTFFSFMVFFKKGVQTKNVWSFNFLTGHS